MTDLSGMYDEGTDLDARLEMAGHMLKEAADAKGVDLNEFSEDQLSEMLTDIVTDGSADNDNAGYEGDAEGKTASDITYADVALELTKRAAYDGVDLSTLEPDDYSLLFSKVAEEMVDPEIAEERFKLAMQYEHMDELGRVAARGFADEINKLAADDEDEEDKKKEEDKVKKAVQLLKIAGFGDTVKGFGKSVAGKANSAFDRVGRGAIDSATGVKGFHKNLSQEGREALGRRVLAAGAGGTLAAGGAGAAIGARRERKKQAELEEVAVAIDVLRGYGYDV